MICQSQFARPDYLILVKICSMAIINFEFKARTSSLKQMEAKLLDNDPDFIGEDHQTDTYFNVPKGRLKLREGNIENALIFYERSDESTSKQSNVLLYTHKKDSFLKEILIKVHGVKVIVDKTRRIYFINNVKFHFDTVPGLGTFIEVEAIDKSGDIPIEKLKSQCQQYANLFGVKEADYVDVSYSDLALSLQESSAKD